MIQARKLGHVVLKVRDAARSRDFYTRALGLKVAHEDLERVGLEWGRRVMGKSPTAQRMVKFALNLIDDGLVGQQVFAGEATRLAYATPEAEEGRDAFLERRSPDWSGYPWHY